MGRFVFSSYDFGIATPTKVSCSWSLPARENRRSHRHVALACCFDRLQSWKGYTFMRRENKKLSQGGYARAPLKNVLTTLARRCKLDKLAISKKPSRYKLACYEWWKKVLNFYMVRWHGQQWSLCWSTGAFHAQLAGMTFFASIVVSSSKTVCWIYAWNDKNVRRVQVKFPCKTIEFSKGISGTVRTCCRTVPEPDLRQTETFASVWDTFPTTSTFFCSLYLFRLWWQEDSTNTCTRVPTNWVLHWNKRHRLAQL